MATPALGTPEYWEAWRQKAQPYGGDIAKAMAAERAQKESNLPLSEQLAASKGRYQSTLSDYMTALRNTFDVPTTLRDRFKTEDKARMEYESRDRAFKEQLGTVASQVHTDPRYSGLSPQEKARIIQEKQRGLANRLSANEAELASHTKSLEELLAGVEGTYKSQAALAQAGLTGEQNLINQIMNELQLQATLASASGGGGYGGYGGYGEGAGDLPPDLLRAFEIDVDEHLEGRAKEPKSLAELMASYAGDTSMSEVDRARMVNYIQNRKAQLDTEKQQSAPSGNWFSGLLKSPSSKLPDNTYTQMLKNYRISKPNYGVQSSSGSIGSNYTVPSAIRW